MKSPLFSPSNSSAIESMLTVILVTVLIASNMANIKSTIDALRTNTTASTTQTQQA